jgi:RluA family pseudouridine synthase
VRLDEAVSRLFSVSKGEARRAVDRGGCRVGGKVVRVASRLVRDGDAITLGLSPGGSYPELVLPPGAVLFEDDEYLAVNKPEGFYCQRTPYQLVGTVEHAVSLLFRERGIAGPVRLVHRLDRGTSGVMLFPKTAAAAAHASKALHDGAAEKVYLALVEGRPPGGSGTVDGAIAAVGKSRFAVRADGRPARTEWRLLAAGEGVSLVEARPRTGRTHQLRLHLREIGCPVVGDDRYGPSAGPEHAPADGAPAGRAAGAPRMMLHCRAMSLRGADGRVVAALAPVDTPFREACLRAGIDGALLDEPPPVPPGSAPATPPYHQGWW